MIDFSETRRRPSTTIYRGMRVSPEQKTASDTLVYVDDKPLDPKPSQKLCNHSPNGFNWGYGGSGPAQLALGILFDYYRSRTFAQRYYQDFKFAVIAKLPQEEDWTMTGTDIEAAMAAIRSEEK